MLFSRPDHETLYAALIARSTNYEGRAYVGVPSTGIFCRFSCDARKPKAENCWFFESIGECLEAGFQACKRCSPLARFIAAEPVIGLLLSALETRPKHRWVKDDFIAMNIDPLVAQRVFKRYFGITFLELARSKRRRMDVGLLAGNGTKNGAPVMSECDGPGAFENAFASFLGRSADTLSRAAMLRAACIATPLGSMVAVSSARALHLLEFVDRQALPSELKKLQLLVKSDIGIGRFEPTNRIEEELTGFFSGRRSRFEVPLAPTGTPFEHSVWDALRAIPFGQTRSYREIAQAIGRPTATRAVARANGANPIALVIPCHRVIGADGSLTGYGGGLWRKRQLIDTERRFVALQQKETSLPR
ncbi:MAG TPA: methylated-DNA--[protein]-cysteine S-methyltransferase [Dongiaceae bacterium]|jgi:AraC family transcriptional regulator of adaptative response/methylated-DNA-[protein]-cysteine methyltransferase|nr:methylated-DNA--[protein]-cysteine S-methyltransferase [Dongiaceae bacterium]